MTSGDSASLDAHLSRWMDYLGRLHLALKASTHVRRCGLAPQAGAPAATEMRCLSRSRQHELAQLPQRPTLPAPPAEDPGLNLRAQSRPHPRQPRPTARRQPSDAAALGRPPTLAAALALPFTPYPTRRRWRSPAIATVGTASPRRGRTPEPPVPSDGPEPPLPDQQQQAPLVGRRLAEVVDL